MTQRKVRVRFAPSPTGALHIGGVRTALYNYLFARQHGGEFIFRIEDTDSNRFVPGAEEYILESFRWLGIPFDEGVSFGGEHGPYRQSERRDIYKKYVQELLDAGKAYIAFDTPEELEAKRQALEKREQETDRLYRQREEDARKAREFREQMQRAKENARSRGEAEAKRILRDARSASDAVFAELERMRKEQAKADRAINANEARAELRRQLNEAEDAIDKRDARSEPIPKPSRPIQKGDLVEIPGVSTPAEVVGVGGDGTLQLKAGILKMKAKADEVRLIEDDERAAMKKKAPKPTRTAVTGLRTAASRELDIRGMETLEAESVVETFLSTAVMGHLETVTIIHGKGTGALRNAVHDILRRNKNVKSFRLGVYGEGENGVTVVTMK